MSILAVLVSCLTTGTGNDQLIGHAERSRHAADVGLGIRFCGGSHDLSAQDQCAVRVDLTLKPVKDTVIRQRDQSVPRLFGNLVQLRSLVVLRPIDTEIGGITGLDAMRRNGVLNAEYRERQRKSRRCSRRFAMRQVIPLLTTDHLAAECELVAAGFATVQLVPLSIYDEPFLMTAGAFQRPTLNQFRQPACTIFDVTLSLHLAIH